MQKSIYVPAVDAEVVIARRRGTRNIRLSVKSNGVIRLTVPFGVSENQALKFLVEKKDWINKHKTTSTTLKDGDHIGKSYRLSVQQVDKRSSRILQNEIRVSLDKPIETPESQTFIRSACERALKNEAENLLPQRLKAVAAKHNFTYKSVKIKKFKSRWGSCDNRNNIALNSYLTQLPWDLIDYVLIHELVHTIHKHHQKAFWDELEKYEPNYKTKRKELKSHPTEIAPTSY